VTGALAMNLLIVDDNPVVRELVRRLVQADPEMNVVAEAGDGEEAVRLARELSPDVVLMDLSMPRLDGIQATQRIKADRPEAKVVILTVHADEAYRRAALASGADGFLSKKTLAAGLVPTLKAMGPERPPDGPSG
jgi:DNA-binding NarL/FixJ family response regulator